MGDVCRTPNGSNSNNEYNVNPAGANNNNNANNSNGVAPDCREDKFPVSVRTLNAVQPCKEMSSSSVSDGNGRKADADASQASLLTNEPKGGVNATDGIPFDFVDLIEATRECKQNVMWKDSVAGFVKNRFVNCTHLMESLRNGTYRLSSYAVFTIHEPKTREIVATSFRDRVVQRALCNKYLYDAITHGFIYDNWACQKDKGTTRCRKRVKELLQRHYRRNGNNGYVLNVDIRNYFGSTPHWVAKMAVEKRVGNAWARDYVFKLIDSFDGITGDHCGIGLGSQISQLIQLSVLDDLDHLMKDRFGVAFYIRYMDDIRIVSKDKDELIALRRIIEEYLNSIGLEFSQSKTYIAPLSHGIKFLGFRFRLTNTGFVTMNVLEKKISKERRRIDRMMRTLPKQKVDESYRSWKANVKQGTTYALIQRMNSYYYHLRRRRYA